MITIGAPADSSLFRIGWRCSNGAPRVQQLGTERLLRINKVMFIPVEGSIRDEKCRILVDELPDQKIENVRFPMRYSALMYLPLLGSQRIGKSIDNR